MKIRDQLILPITILLIMCFAPLGSDSFPNYIPVAFGHQQRNSSFQAEISTINNDISTQKVKVEDIEIAYKQIGNGSGTPPIVLILQNAYDKEYLNWLRIKGLGNTMIQQMDKV
jgi:hypothetical protein